MKTKPPPDLIAWLEQWYRSQCDGDWEHTKGVEIITLDNPGWLVKADLQPLPGRGGADRVLVVVGEPPSAANGNVGGNDWMECKITGGQFVGAGDPGKLGAILVQLQAVAAGEHAPVTETRTASPAISMKQVRNAQDAQKNDGSRIGYRLIKTGAIEESKLTEFLSKQYGVPAINLKDFVVPPEVIRLVPRRCAEMHKVLPVNLAANTLIIATADPSNIFAIDEVSTTTGLKIEVVVASEVAIDDAIARYYGPR